MPAHTQCRICETPLPKPFLDLGTMPLANTFLSSPEEFAKESRYPLAVAGCPRCGLVQLTYVVNPEQLYRHYVYVSSTSEVMRRYAQDLAARIVERFHLGSSHLVVELGSNDGLVLRAFQQRGVKVLGVEPARNIAAIARASGIPTVEEFFTAATARDLIEREGQAAVILGRHVFAHIDDVHDFFRGVSAFLAPGGVLLIEVPYLGTLIDQLEFDTIYHEHLSYLAAEPMSRLCERDGFQLVDAEPVTLHGGSLLFSIQREGSGRKPTERLQRLLAQERNVRLTDPETLSAFAERVQQWKREFESCVEQLTRSGAVLAGYGAAAKANTLLNFCPDVARRLHCLLDRSPHKYGLYAPGTHLQVVNSDSWEANGTSHLLILAWNFKEEIMRQMEPFTRRGGRFIIPIPQPEVV